MAHMRWWLEPSICTKADRTLELSHDMQACEWVSRVEAKSPSLSLRAHKKGLGLSSSSLPKTLYVNYSNSASRMKVSRLSLIGWTIWTDTVTLCVCRKSVEAFCWLLSLSDCLCVFDFERTRDTLCVLLALTLCITHTHMLLYVSFNTKIVFHSLSRPSRALNVYVQFLFITTETTLQAQCLKHFIQPPPIYLPLKVNNKHTYNTIGKNTHLDTMDILYRNRWSLV